MNFEIPRLGELIRVAKVILREEGFLSLFKQLFFAYRAYFLYENTLDGSTFASKTDNLTLKLISAPGELEQLLLEGFTFSPYHMSIQQCKERLNRGAIMFCAFVGKKLAHGSWVATSREACSDFHPFPMDCEHTAYVGGTMTILEYRRKGINLYIHSEIFRYLKKKGLSRAVLAIDKGNIAAQDSQNKLGSRIWGRGYDLRLLILKLKRLSPNRGLSPVSQSHCQSG